MEYNEKAILRTLIYSSIFQYPLTKEEIWAYAISEKPLDKKKVPSILEKNPVIHKRHQFYFLAGDDVFVNIREIRSKIASEKLHIAKKVSRILSYLPTIQFIGLSGSLAMENTREEDDIDFFIITADNTVWVTRICILVILALLGKRRARYATQVKNKICVNFLVELSHIALPDTMKNLYTAHEIAQLKPLFSRNQAYDTFLSANIWVTTFLPNFEESITIHTSRKQHREKNFILIQLCNFIAKKAQLWYMKRQRTSEIITDTVLAFYTDEMPKKVLRLYKEKVNTYEI